MFCNCLFGESIKWITLVFVSLAFMLDSTNTSSGESEAPPTRLLRFSLFEAPPLLPMVGVCSGFLKKRGYSENSLNQSDILNGSTMVFLKKEKMAVKSVIAHH